MKLCFLALTCLLVPFSFAREMHARGKVLQLSYIATSNDVPLCPSHYEDPESFVQVFIPHYIPAPDIDCPKEAVEGERIVFSAKPIDTKNLKYTWAVTGGKIVAGQGTRRITVDTAGVGGQTITATIEMGYGQHTSTSSCTATVLMKSSGVLGQERVAPQFTLKDLNGRTVRLSDYQGKVVLINFWATWCPPCRAEMPDLVRLQREHGKEGLQIIGVTYPPEKKERVRRFARSLKVNYPIILGTRQFKARFSSDETLPLTIVINRDGKVSDIISGILLRQEVEEKIKPLLKKEK